MQVNPKLSIDNNSINQILNGSYESKHVGTLFATQLKEKVESQQKIKLLDQQQSLILQAQNLLQNIDIKKLQQYRENLRDFFEDLTKQTYSFQEEKYTDNYGRSQYYSTVETVNRELEDLFELTKESEKNRMEILSKMNCINGLIINLII